jgi:hypothetical protein
VTIYDWEALNKRGEDVYGLDQFKIGQVRLLFSIEQNSTKYQLAYIQWFNIGARDTETKMSVAFRTEEYNIIGVDAIVRNIHLIPFFETPNSATNMRQQNIDEYSLPKYLVNHYSDAEAWEEFY